MWFNFNSGTKIDLESCSAPPARPLPLLFSFFYSNRQFPLKALGTILWTKTFWVNNNFFAAYFHCKNIYRKGIMPHGYIKCDFGADFSQK